MLPKRERLSRKEFSRFFTVTKRIHASHFTVLYAPYESLHVSVVVSKKVAPHAVDRNKLRRRIYDIVRLYRKEEGLTGVYIFLVKPSACGVSYEILREMVRTIIHNITQ